MPNSFEMVHVHLITKQISVSKHYVLVPNLASFPAAIREVVTWCEVYNAGWDTLLVMGDIKCRKGKGEYRHLQGHQEMKLQDWPFYCIYDNYPM